jgi:DNA-directed RNA polymerase subunit H (RpoH/RPB5)
MSSLNNNLSSIYNNLYTFFKYRKLIPLEDKLEDSEFIKHIYNNEYFIINTIAESTVENDKNTKEMVISEIKENLNNTKYINKENYKVTYIVLFHYSTDINSKTPEFKKIIALIDKNPFLYDIIIITKNSLSTHVKNYIKTINNKVFPSVLDKNPICKLNHNINLCNCFKLNIFMYVYDLFAIIIPKHILSNEHNILPYKDVDNLLNNVLFCKKNNLPKIKISDPQIIWSSGKVGDVVCITRNSDISGLSLYYRVITH